MTNAARAAVDRANAAIVADAVDRHDPAGAAEERALFAERALALAPLLTPRCRPRPHPRRAVRPRPLLRRAVRATPTPAA